MDYAEALQINPEYAEVYNNRGIVFGILESPDKALTNFTKALELRPRFAEAYYNRSLAHLRLKQYDQALKDTLLAQKMGKALKPEYIQKIQWIAGNVPSGP